MELENDDKTGQGHWAFKAEARVQIPMGAIYMTKPIKNDWFKHMKLNT